MTGFLKRTGFLLVWAVAILQCYLLALYINPWIDSMTGGGDGGGAVLTSYGVILALIVCAVAYLAKDKHGAIVESVRGKIVVTLISPWALHLFILAIVVAVVITVVSVPYWYLTNRWLWRLIGVWLD